MSTLVIHFVRAKEPIGFSVCRKLAWEMLPEERVTLEKRRVTWWHEVKAPNGAQRTDQHTFQVLAVACGETYLLGGLDVAEDHCQQLGLLRARTR
jgi:hypothetical protein